MSTVAVKWSARGSWHLVANPQVIDFRDQVTFCGRDDLVGRERASELPGNEKTCERCAVLAEKRAAEEDTSYGTVAPI